MAEAPKVLMRHFIPSCFLIGMPLGRLDKEGAKIHLLSTLVDAVMGYQLCTSRAHDNGPMTQIF